MEISYHEVREITGMIGRLTGQVSLFGIPAGEVINLEFRKRFRRKGKIRY